MAAFIAKICVDNNIHGHYVEPYAGGASVAIFLLLEGYVRNITINDQDRSIFAFWKAVLDYTDDLCEMIDSTPITMESWRVQKEIQRTKANQDILALGFSTLFLNRTNRSGIIKGGVIGGINQDGNYKIDCRFNKEEIKQRIRAIANYRDYIELYNLDAIDLIDIIQARAQDSNAIFYFDPPYYLKADSLYMNYYKDDHHKKVSDKIKGIRNIHWVISYDNNENIENLYQGIPQKKYTFNHSAFSAREGKEILFFSPEILQPSIVNYNPIRFKLKRRKSLKEIVYSE